jgi:hypothetical protein
MLVEMSRNVNSPYTDLRALWREYRQSYDPPLLMRLFHHMRGSFKLMRNTTCMISIGLTAHTEEEVVDLAAEATTSAEEAIGTVTTANLLLFVDWDHEETTVEVDGTTKGPARGDAMSVESQDAGRSITPGRNEDNHSITSASNTTSLRAKRPLHRISRCSLATLKERRRQKCGTAAIGMNQPGCSQT